LQPWYIGGTMAHQIEFLYDFASPYSYLARAQIQEFASSHALRLECTPVYLRGLDSFSKGVPYSATKLRHMQHDLIRCARLLDVPYETPTHFPLNGLYLLRGALYLAGNAKLTAYQDAAWRAAWAEAKPVSDADSATAIAESVGVDPRAFRAGISDAAIKDQLKANTDRATERGVFGLPTFFLGEEMFFGQDRLPMVSLYLRSLEARPA
jgi:2-hydroxychromene-2-carboxylate isomerase